LLVLAGHIDTVRPQGNEMARRENGNIIGLGATDMKAGIAVMLGLIEGLDFAHARFDVACVFYDCEEGSASRNGLKRVLARMPWLKEARLAIVLEPTDLNVEMGCNGTVNLEVRVPGVSAHAARPWTGRNAVTEGADWLASIARVPKATVRVQGLEFRETLEVTRLRAGSARNVLPGQMLVNLNHRFPPDRTEEEAVARVRAVVPEAYGIKVRSSSPPGRVCLDDEEVQRFIGRFGAPVLAKQGWTDVARFTSHGIPAFNFGPGLAELCHRADEYCPVANLGVAYERLATWLTSER
jgi:succinyl-diaminopimelate desuccinylase